MASRPEASAASPAFGGFARNARPGLEGGLAFPAAISQVPEPVLDVAAAGPAPGQPVQTFSGPVETLLAQLAFGLEQLGPELAIARPPAPPPRQPGRARPRPGSARDVASSHRIPVETTRPGRAMSSPGSCPTTNTSIEVDKVCIDQ